jgi:hypothetical protein
MSTHARPRQLAEHAAMYDVRPPVVDEAAMCAAIEAIQDQLARNIPNLQREMDEMLIRLRKPGLN